MKNLLLIGLTLFTLSSFGQYTTLSYSTATPLGGYRDYVASNSWQGFEFAYQHKFGENFAVGVQYKYQKFYEKKDRATYDFDNDRGTGAITGVRYTYSFVNNFNVSLNYIGQTNTMVTPYAGLAIGPAYIDNLLVVGVYELDDDVWKFAMEPHVGLMFEIGPGIALDLKVSYNYISLNYENVGAFQALGVGLGFTWSPFIGD